MSDAAPNGSLLEELIAMPTEARRDRLFRAGDPRSTVVELGDEAERLVLVEANRALRASKMVMELADEVGFSLGRARARRARAQALTYSGRASEALGIANEAVQLAEGSNELIEAGRDRMAVLHALVELGRYDDALRAGEDARQIFLRAGAPQFAARADINLGVVHQNRDDPASALAHFERARPGLVNEPAMLGPLESNRGEALLNLNDLAGAEAAFLRARSVFETTGANLAAAIVEGNLADLSVRQGSLDQAMFHFERARRRLEADASVGHLARVLAEQADALGVLGLPDQARRSYLEALPRLAECGLVAEEGRARAGLARALLALGQLTEADAQLSRATDSFLAIGHTSSGAHVQLIRAQVVDALGQSEFAQSLAQQALRTLEDRPADAAVARYTIARLSLRGGEAQRAIDALAPALAAVEQLDIPPVWADLLHLQGLAYRELGKLDDAASSLQRAAAQIERVRGSLQAERFRAAFLGDRIKVYEDLVRTLLDQARDTAVADAFSATEQAKSRALLDLVRGTLDLTQAAARDVENAQEAELLKELVRLRGELSALYSRLNRGGQDNQRRVLGPAWHESLRARERKLEALEDRLASAKGVAGLYAPSVDLDTALSIVEPDTAIVEYFFAGDELLAFVLRDGGARVFRGLAQRSAIEDAITRLRFQMVRASGPAAQARRRSARLLDDARADLLQLNELLVQPLRAAIDDCESLTFIGHGPLHYVPFHALWDGAKHLIETHHVHSCPSTSLLVQLANRTDSVGAGASIVVGVADDAAPQIRHEARTIAQRLPGSTLLLDAEATVESVGDAMPAARIIHMACHGVFSHDEPMASGLQLADRWMTVRDVYQLRLSAELITLSGCDTGRTHVTSGDELLGLVRGFFAAGARSMLVSLWSVGDESTADLMDDFYRIWPTLNGHKCAKIRALREAQLRMIQTRPHPVHWAAFQLVGRP
jgi:CHAT domain-containing protein